MTDPVFFHGPLKMGFAGLDYHYKIMQLHPDWIKAAKDLVLSVNVWTVNDPEMAKTLMDQGVDYITTDKPVEIAQVVGNKSPRKNEAE